MQTVALLPFRRVGRSLLADEAKQTLARGLAPRAAYHDASKSSDKSMEAAGTASAGDDAAKSAAEGIEDSAQAAYESVVCVEHAAEKMKPLAARRRARPSTRRARRPTRIE